MGFNFQQFLGVLTTIAPAVLLAVPGGAALAPITNVIIAGIAHAEATPEKSGTQKKDYVMALVKDAVSGTNLVRPGTVDPALLEQAASHAIDAVVTSVNAVTTAHAAQPGIPSLATTAAVNLADLPEPSAK